jgi:transposase
MGAKCFCLHSQERSSAKHPARLAALQGLNLKVGRAWAIKEACERSGRSCAGRQRRFFLVSLASLQSARAHPEGGRDAEAPSDCTLRYRQHSITNGASEGLNSKIMTLKLKACGFRNPRHLQAAIYCLCLGARSLPKTLKRL